MNKPELIALIATNANLTKADASRALDGFIDAVACTLKAGDTVNLVGFGTFSVKERAARKGRNPKTGEEIAIPASKVPEFKAGKKLREFVHAAH